MFLMAIEGFHDHLAMDQAIWDPSPWSELDARLDIEKHVNAALHSRRTSYMSMTDRDENNINWDSMASDKGKWKSTVLTREAVIKHIRQIWDAFFGKTASFEICIDARMRARTVFRLRNIHLYGMHAFDEATTDPMKTVKKDLLPRFLASQFYRDMKERLKQIEYLPEADTFHIDPPRSSAVAAMDMSSPTVVQDLESVPLSQIIEDSIMYDALKSYLTSIFASELLLCARCVARYKELWSEHTPPPAGARSRSEARLTVLAPPGVADLAWVIYAYFIADNSAYEVSLSHRRRRQILQDLAEPTAVMFDRMQAYNIMGLKDHQIRFYASEYFKSIPQTILKEQGTKTSHMHMPHMQVLEKEAPPSIQHTASGSVVVGRVPRRKAPSCFSFLM
jgi:hypothetical protein